MSLRFGLIGTMTTLLIGPAAALRPAGSEAELQARQLTAQIALVQAIDRLGLTRDQLEQILPLAQESAEEAEAIVEARGAQEREYAAALSLLHREVLANNGVADDTKAAVHRAKAPWERLMDQHMLRSRERAEGIIAIIGDNLPKGAGPRRGRPRRLLDDPDHRRTAVTKLFLSPWAAPVLEVKLGLRKATDIPTPEGYRPDASTLKLEEDIRVLNLVNSLYLTAEQMREMRDLIRRAEPILNDRDAAARRSAEAALPALTELRDKALAGQVLPRDGERLRDGERRRFHIEASHARRLSPLVEEMKSLLTDNQEVLVAEFIPCLVPVRSLTNPERVGQASDNEGAIQLLSRVRQMPERHAARALEIAKQRTGRKMSEKNLPDSEIDQAKARLEDAFREARSLTDAEFEVRKSELAEQIGPPVRPPVSGRAFDLRVAGYLLSPNLLPIYDDRIAAEGER